MAAHANARLEAFCDGVFAIALTLLILEIRPPAGAHLQTSEDLWRALAALLPSVFAFVLSFVAILITWVNHHLALKGLDKSSTPFVYANGLLLLGVVLMPFSTALLGQNLLTAHAAPAVVIYCANGAFTAVAWALIGWTALRPKPLTKNERATARIRNNAKNSIFGIVVYTALAIAAAWLPLTIAIVMTALWTYWLIYGLRASADAHAD
jgi:uncharacterized membrane protein